MSSRNRTEGSQGSNAANRTDYQRAKERLDAAVRELGSAAKDSLTDRAAIILEETTERLKKEFRSGSLGGDNGDGSSLGSTDGYGYNYDYDYRYNYNDSGTDWGSYWGLSQRKKSRANRTKKPRAQWEDRRYDTRAVRDLDRKKVFGVCAGIAPSWRMEIWVVRCLAVTGFLFIPQVVLPAYIIAAIVLEPVGGSVRKRSRRAKRRSKRRSQRANTGAARTNAATAVAPEPPPVAPRTRLRTVRNTLDEAELRLRQMERHVTSSRFELQRELNKIDG